MDIVGLDGLDAARVSARAAPLRSAGLSAEPGDGQRVAYIFSDESVARDGHTIATDGWRTGHFESNPVFLWCHDSTSPPVGKVVEITRSGSQLRGVVEYPDDDVSPFGAMIYRMVRGGFLNATSVSWSPIKWRYATDKSRAPGAIDFLEQELLEVSQVPVPSLPTALATARASGIDTGPLYAWAEKILDGGGMIAIPRAEIETLRREAKMPKPARAVVDPAATVVDPAPPTVEMAPVRAFDVKARAFRVMTGEARQRGLYEVAELCYALQSLSWVLSSIDWEADYEGDGSPIPDRFANWLDQGNAILADMAKEETSENMTGRQAPEAVEDAVERAVSRAFARAGKVLSDENRAALEDAHDRVAQCAADLENARCMVRAVLDKGADKPAETDDDAAAAESERALRERRARALAAKARIAG